MCVTLLHLQLGSENCVTWQPWLVSAGLENLYVNHQSDVDGDIGRTWTLHCIVMFWEFSSLTGERTYMQWRWSLVLFVSCYYNRNALRENSVHIWRYCDIISELVNLMRNYRNWLLNPVSHWCDDSGDLCRQHVDDTDCSLGMVWGWAVSAVITLSQSLAGSVTPHTVLYCTVLYCTAHSQSGLYCWILNQK